MDVVYVCRDGENPELRYSLRSLSNVPHETVHIVGGHPDWINTATVTVHRQPPEKTKYATTTASVEYACRAGTVSDPFMLWNDDFYAIAPTTVQPMHRGNLDDVMRQYRTRPGAWADGLRVTTTHLKQILPGQILYSYEVHVPLIVRKKEMLDALAFARTLPTGAPHKRTIYSNMAQLGGVQVRDPKVSHETRSFPNGPWLSSDDSGFGSLVAPFLQTMFPSPCRYEDQVR